MNVLDYALGYALGRGVFLPLLRAIFSRWGLIFVLGIVLAFYLGG